MIIETIPLDVFSKEEGFHANINIKIDGHLTKVLLDTGAPFSRVKSDNFISKYKSTGTKESKGVSGIGHNVETFSPEIIHIGDQKVTGIQLERGEDEGVLGLDILKNLIFQYELEKSSIHIIKKIPGRIENVNVLKTGHLTVPLMVGGIDIFGLFDTGSDATVFDDKFIRENQQLFKLVKNDIGTDAHGNKVESRIYQCSKVVIGEIELNEVEVAGFEYPNFLRGKMEGSPVILGNNIIGKGKWSFDIKSKKWSFTK